MIESTSEKHPIDFDSLKHGDVITVEQIEKIYSMPRTDSGFHFKVLELWGDIERECDLLVRSDGQNLRIMEDLEAEEVTNRRVHKAARSMMRNAKRRAVINRDGFTEEQKRLAETRDSHITAFALFSRKEIAKARRNELLLSGKREDKDAAE